MNTPLLMSLLFLLLSYPLYAVLRYVEWRLFR